MMEISKEDFEEYFESTGDRFQDAGIGFKHGTGFGPQGMDAEIQLLEKILNFKFPSDYLDIITDGGQMANGHFGSGWWRVKNTDDEMVLWSFSLSLRPRYTEHTARKERTIPI